MKIIYILLYLALIPVLSLLMAPFFNPHYAIYTGIYFYNNVYNFKMNAFSAVIDFIAMLGVYTAVLLTRLRGNPFAVLASLGIAISMLGFYGIYTPFVITASILGISDFFIIIAMMFVSYDIGRCYNKSTRDRHRRSIRKI